MRSSILLSSVAVAALATPAFALPDRYEQGYSCTSMGFNCLQQEMRHDDGNRAFDKGNEGAVGAIGGGGLAARAGDDDDDADLGNEIGDAADEAGDEISAAADEAGDEISEAADEAGDAIGDAFD
jgi:hypothetical protein